jgi:hypothetical protein
VAPTDISAATTARFTIVATALSLIALAAM